MSDYSYTAPCSLLRLNPELADELRKAVGLKDGLIENPCDQPAYLVQMRSLLAKDEPLPFPLIKTYWKNHKEGVSLSRWTAKCSLILPSVVVPPRNEVLEQRCRQLRARLEHQAYDSMVASVDRGKALQREYNEDGPGAWRQLRRQYIAVINALVTIGGVFAFFYKAVEYALPEPNVAGQVLVAIFACIIVSVAELYFLLRSL